MDYSTILERLKLHWLPIFLGLTSFVFLLYGLTVFVTPKKDKPDILFDAAKDARSAGSGQAASLAKQVETKHVTVDVEGAVEKPGVYDLPADARVQDALIAAGGMSREADRDRIAKSLNLAAKLTDGDKIYIPFPGDSSSGVLAEGSGADAVLGAETALININTASAKDLDSLPGVGDVTAGKIIAGRPYGAIEELTSKKVVSQKVFGEIKDKVSVY